MAGSNNGPLETPSDTPDPMSSTSTVSVTPSEVHALVRRFAPAARDVELDPENRFVTFWYEDQDADLLRVQLYIRAASLEIFIGLAVEDDDYVAALEAANEWNWNQNLHVPGYAVLALERPNSIYLRSIFPTTDGVPEVAFESWINTFLESVNAWENLVLESLSSVEGEADDGEDLEQSELRGMSWYESGRLDPEILEAMVWRAVPAARSVSVESGVLSICAESLTGDEVRFFLFQSADHPSIIRLLVGIDIHDCEPHHLLSACNQWNHCHYPHESVSYVVETEGGVVNSAYLESSLTLVHDDFEEYLENWLLGFVEAAAGWQTAISAAIPGEEETGQPFLEKVGAGIAAVAPFFAKAAEVLGDALLESLADDIRGKGEPRGRNQSNSSRYQQRSGNRRRSSTSNRQQRRSN